MWPSSYRSSLLRQNTVEKKKINDAFNKVMCEGHDGKNMSHIQNVELGLRTRWRACLASRCGERIHPRQILLFVKRIDCVLGIIPSNWTRRVRRRANYESSAGLGSRARKVRSNNDELVS